MSDPREEDLTAEERRARQALKTLPRPQADPAFRARLRRDFVSGAFTARARATAVGPRWRPRASWVWAPVAAGLLVLAGAWLNRGPGWTVASAGSDGFAIVDGRPIPMLHREDLARALRDGGAIRLESTAELELVAPGQLAIEVTAATDATVPPAPGLWFGRAVRGAVRSGELRITTGRGFRGARLAVETPEAEVEVTGTTLAVIRERVGTCVCVMDGRVMMGAQGGAMAPIAPGMRRFMFNDGRPAEEDSMRPMEKVKLGQMRTRYASTME
jgi:hypothetical protein